MKRGMGMRYAAASKSIQEHPRAGESRQEQTRRLTKEDLDLIIACDRMAVGQKVDADSSFLRPPSSTG